MKMKTMIHHSASPQATTTLELVNEWHKQRGFNLSSLGYYVGYHYLIAPTGEVYQTRAIGEDGCHCIAFDEGEHTSFNKSSVGICLMGNFEFEDPTPEQIKSLEGLLKNLKPQRILGHRDVASTLCPGKSLYHKLFEYKELYGA